MITFEHIKVWCEDVEQWNRLSGRSPSNEEQLSYMHSEIKELLDAECVGLQLDGACDILVTAYRAYLAFAYSIRNKQAWHSYDPESFNFNEGMAFAIRTLQTLEACGINVRLAMELVLHDNWRKYIPVSDRTVINTTANMYAARNVAVHMKPAGRSKVVFLREGDSKVMKPSNFNDNPLDLRPCFLNSGLEYKDGAIDL